MNAVALTKFGELEHIKSLVGAGQLYFNTIQFFSNEEDDHRFDEFEGVDKIYQAEDIISLSLDDELFKLVHDQPPIKFRMRDGHNFTHLCCFTIVRRTQCIIDGIQRIFDPNMFSFGDTVAIVIDIEKFISQIQKAINNAGIINSQIGEVQYVDATSYSGNWGLFRKRKQYQYQQEFRIAVEYDSDRPFILEIRNYKDLFVGIVSKEECVNIVENGNAILSR